MVKHYHLYDPRQLIVVGRSIEKQKQKTFSFSFIKIDLITYENLKWNTLFWLISIQNNCYWCWTTSINRLLININSTACTRSIWLICICGYALINSCIENITGTTSFTSITFAISLAILFKNKNRIKIELIKFNSYRAFASFSITSI